MEDNCPGVAPGSICSSQSPHSITLATPVPWKVTARVPWSGPHSPAASSAHSAGPYGSTHSACGEAVHGGRAHGPAAAPGPLSASQGDSPGKQRHPREASPDPCCPAVAATRPAPPGVLTRRPVPQRRRPDRSLYSPSLGTPRQLLQLHTHTLHECDGKPDS